MDRPFSPQRSYNLSATNRHKLALDSSGIGTWEYDPDEKTFVLSDDARDILGISATDAVELQTLLGSLILQDRRLFEASLNQLTELPETSFGGNQAKNSNRISDEYLSINIHTEIADSDLVNNVLFRGKRYFNEDNNKPFLLGTVISVGTSTKDIVSDIDSERHAPVQEEKYKYLLEQVPVGICLFVGKDMVVEMANEPMIGYWGKDASVIGKPLAVAFPELVGQPFLDILANILVTGESYTATNAAVDIVVDGVLATYYFNFTYKPLFNDKGEVYAIIDMSLDVTEQVIAEKALKESESKLRSVIASAPAAMALFVGEDLIVDTHNQSFLEVVGSKVDLNGKLLRDFLPALSNQDHTGIVDHVYSSGEGYQIYNIPFEIKIGEKTEQRFYNFNYSPIFDHDGGVNAILCVATDVTSPVEIQQKIEKSQLQLLSLFEQSPIAIAMLSKENLVFTMANPFYARLVGKTSEQLLGKPLLEAIPELEGQGFDLILNNVINTRTPYRAHEQHVIIKYNEILTSIYVDFIYQPQSNIEGEITGILVVVIDVTEQVLARQKIAEAEVSLRGAIELADLGTWRMDFQSGEVEFSPRLREWFGVAASSEISAEENLKKVVEQDRPAVIAALEQASADNSEGIYDIEYTIENAGIKRILHAQGKTLFDVNGKARSISGTVQDVTLQREIKLALEIQVQERTEELAATNEEMAAINEEYMAINEELTESNHLLTQSNENLQRFAYVASHDLQEPLRKIQSFGDLLANRYSQQLGEGANYLTRMQAASRRMSELIEDLLLFSRIADKSQRIETFSLTDMISSVLDDLELSIQESDAKVTVEELPQISGDRFQLSQLFQNLISNALKFRNSELPVEIKISNEIINRNELPTLVGPIRYSRFYYHISVADNGIGFDQKYADRIFQLFQRLHGKNEYKGTGIGLAICDKVASNHGGAMAVRSEPGKGATFSLFLPAEKALTTA